MVITCAEKYDFPLYQSVIDSPLVQIQYTDYILSRQSYFLAKQVTVPFIVTPVRIARQLFRIPLAVGCYSVVPSGLLDKAQAFRNGKVEGPLTKHKRHQPRFVLIRDFQSVFHVSIRYIGPLHGLSMYESHMRPKDVE